MLWRAGLWSQRQGGSSMCISCCFLLLGARHWQLLLHLLLPSLCWARLETSSLGCSLEGKGDLRLLLPLLTLAESETLSKAPGLEPRQDLVPSRYLCLQTPVCLHLGWRAKLCTPPTFLLHLTLLCASPQRQKSQCWSCCFGECPKEQFCIASEANE